MSTGAAPGWTCTKTGVVRYPRPPKPFTPRDVLRVVRKVDYRTEHAQAWAETLVALLEDNPFGASDLAKLIADTTGLDVRPGRRLLV